MIKICLSAIKNQPLIKTETSLTPTNNGPKSDQIPVRIEMSKEGENEIFNRTEVLQEVPSSIVISEDSEGQESMDFSVSLV